MGTNTPHTCIPGWFGKNKHVDFHNLSSKSANSNFPFILYVLAQHYTTRGYAAAIFPLGEYGPLAMSLHFPLPNSHFSFLRSHFPSIPSRRGHHCGAENCNEFTLSIAKIFFAIFVPPLSNGTSRATSDRKPKTNDQILPSPILFFPSKN